MNVKTKIDKLGGYKENPLCQYKNTINDVTSFENEFKVELPLSFREFLIDYMAFCFVENIHHKCLNSKLKKRLGLESFSVSHFFSLNSDDQCSIQSEIRSLDHLEKNYIPFCYGEVGDYMCISVNKHDFGSIYYFLTVSIDNFHLFKIADSFPIFFKGLFINNEENIDHSKGNVIKATYSDEFIRMMKEWEKNK